MAAVSLSPIFDPLSTNMSGTARRIPLSNNQNVANSPIRSSAAAFAAAKQKRSYANQQREEAYGQVPPPAKKQMLESGIPRPLNSPSKRMAKPQVPLQTRRTTSTYESRLARERMGHHQTQHTESRLSKYTEKDLEEIRQWREHHRARFPRMVFYFENIPTEVRAKLGRQIEKLGAREDKFFSNDITHVVTTRSIPPEKSARQREEEAANAATEIHDGHEQVQTINPSLLNRVTDGTPSVRRKLFDTTSTSAVPGRRPLTQLQDARPKRNMDVLHRAREMGKKIWSMDKLQRMLSMLLEEDLLISAHIAYGGSKGGSVKTSHTDSRSVHEPNLLQLLQNERVNGPSDRDPTVTTQELHYFKGPYVYVYDFEEKQKPVMVREYQKVADKADGDWPQFRTAPLGRCPFVEDYDHREVAKPKPKPKPKQVIAKPAVDGKSALQPPEAPSAKTVTGKRSLGEMESAHNRGSSVTSTEFINPMKPGNKFEFRPNFTSRAGTTRLFGGEPVASGVQPSNVTSAIRSQMISSTAATPGAIGMMSKEVHGLQRKVLQRNSSHDLSSRRAGSVDPSLRDDTARRALTLARTSSRKLDTVDDAAPCEEDEDEDAKVRAQAEKRAAVKAAKKRDPKPGYCENCQDKFADFEDHIASRKHRKFADNPDNWTELDDLLSELQREPKHKSFTAWTPSLPAFAY
ncbi:G1-S regulator (Dfp1/Him1) [Apiospora saccharicola]